MACRTAGNHGNQSSNVIQLSAARRLLHSRTRLHEISAVYSVDTSATVSIPLYGSNVAAGFPSPADDYLDKALDFNDLLVENPAATFAVRIAGESMTGVGLFPGDIAVVDRSKSPKSGAIILALVDGEFTIKRYRKRGGQTLLQSENAKYRDLVISEDSQFEVWGVVTKAIRML